MTQQSKATLVGKVHPDVLAFTVGQDPILDLELAEWDCLGTAAHVATLARLRGRPPVIRPAEARRVLQALAELRDEARAGRLVITAADQDVHLAIERLLTARLAREGTVDAGGTAGAGTRLLRRISRPGSGWSGRGSRVPGP